MDANTHKLRLTSNKAGYGRRWLRRHAAAVECAVRRLVVLIVFYVKRFLYTCLFMSVAVTMYHVSWLCHFTLLIFFLQLFNGLSEFREPPRYDRQYDRQFLLLRDSGVGTVDPLADIPEEIIWGNPSARYPDGACRAKQAMKRGRRGGVQQRLKRLGHRRIPLPNI